MNKHGKHLLDNLGLRIWALVIACFMWFAVTTQSNPTTQKSYSNIPVKLTNTDTITSEGKVVTVLDGTGVISTVTLRAPRSVTDTLDADNISATADVRQVRDDGTVPVSFTTNRYSSQVSSIKGSSDTIRVSIENRKTGNFMLHASTTGTPAEGYIQGDITLDQNQIRVSGPESVVSSIASAEAVVDIGNATGTITTNVDIHLLDSDGQAVDTSSLTLNISTVKVTVSILPTKEVSISASAQGTPAAGYIQTGQITVEPQTVLIAGRSAVLNEVSAITIPASALDVTGASQDVTAQVDLNDYLPEGVRLADSSFDGMVTVTASVGRSQAREYVVHMADIQLVNVPSGYQASLVTVSDSAGGTASQADSGKNLTLRLSGLEDTLDQIGSGDLTMTVDVTGLIKEAGDEDLSGMYSGNVTVKTPAGVSAESSLRAAVRLTAESQNGN